MRAALLLGLGGEDQLAVGDDVPVTRVAPGHGLVRLRTGWYSKEAQSAADAAGDAGWMGNALAFPRIQGADACGEIAAVGTGVDAGRVGERVLVDPILRDPNGAIRYFGS